ncbi:hypothetical protein NSB25_25020 [Acetatifactor muris]|uniref:hypothetical protein n=1 Tax=Acetatifactor muris TaxID=879566 RepID=UPI001FA86FF2|nr:hypothetical protein [Acetatifactor muris]MCR2050499.1 hypothetical protein [Acetatifactor muris]
MSVKTEMLEKQQQMMLGREHKQRLVFSCIMYSAAVYLVFFDVCFIERFLFHEFDVVGGKEILFAEFNAWGTAAALQVLLEGHGMVEQLRTLRLGQMFFLPGPL